MESSRDLTFLTQVTKCEVSPRERRVLLFHFHCEGSPVAPFVARDTTAFQPSPLRTPLGPGPAEGRLCSQPRVAAWRPQQPALPPGGHVAEPPAWPGAQVWPGIMARSGVCVPASLEPGEPYMFLRRNCVHNQTLRGCLWVRRCKGPSCLEPRYHCHRVCLPPAALFVLHGLRVRTFLVL